MIDNVIPLIVAVRVSYVRPTQLLTVNGIMPNVNNLIRGLLSHKHDWRSTYACKFGANGSRADDALYGRST
jgi:hypothetical protein